MCKLSHGVILFIQWWLMVFFSSARENGYSQNKGESLLKIMKNLDYKNPATLTSLFSLC